MSFSFWALGCGDSCPDAWKTCGEDCVDLETNEDNCGECGFACGEDEECVEGSCVCRSNFTLCGDECVYTYTDRKHCGECFNECSVDEVCRFEGCVRCEETGLAQCGDVCKNIHFNHDHCGGCDRKCGKNEVCIYGECATGECEDYDYSTCCIIGCACQDTLNDPLHCGRCWNKCWPEEAVCVDGSCQVGTCEDYSFTSCPFVPDVSPEWNICVDLMTDILHCGGCYNACEAGQSCVDGICQN